MKKFSNDTDTFRVEKMSVYSKEMIKWQVKFHEKGCNVQQGKKKINFAFVRNKTLRYNRTIKMSFQSSVATKKNKMEF